MVVSTRIYGYETGETGFGSGETAGLWTSRRTYNVQHGILEQGVSARRRTLGRRSKTAASSRAFCIAAASADPVPVWPAGASKSVHRARVP